MRNNRHEKQNSRISIVAAISKNNCIGKNGTLPWHIPEDLKRAKKLTLGKNVIMGRKTWESIPEKYKPLPGRKNIVITSNPKYIVPDEVETYPNIQEAINSHKGEEIVGFGGQKIFEEMIEIADVLYITHVDQKIEECHAFFPKIDENIWEEFKRENFNGFSFAEYKRKKNKGPHTFI